jgi:arginine exporter protein ArgO
VRVLTAILAGIVAGLGIALPLGAIGVLIVREAVERGTRPAVAAALAVATVDFAYAVVAVVVGGRVADWLDGYERIVQLVGACALAAVVAHGLWGLRRQAAQRSAILSGAGPAPGGTGGATTASIALPTSHVFARFVALTIVNPMTAVYFVSLTTGLADQVTGAGAGAAFAVGVFVGSAAWQLVLALGGAVAAARMTDRLRVRVSLAGYGIVALYAVRLALGG